jgi:hypothetical protein
MRPPSGVSAREAPAAELSQRLRLALGLLKQARDYAQDLELDPWDFAVELDSLQSSGVTVSDLRWLVCKGYAQHATESPANGNGHRRFRPAGPLTLTARSCFVVTGAGIAAVTNGNATVVHVHDIGLYRARCSCDAPTANTPRWDSSARKLWLHDVLVKWFRVPAANQELILASFQEEGWPPHIDDPLPPQYELDPKKRLHDTINRLNRHQRRRMIRFMGNGDGRGVRWEGVR